MFDLNRSSSHCSTSYAFEDEVMNALHDAWVSLDEANVYTSSDSISFARFDSHS